MDTLVTVAFVVWAKVLAPTAFVKKQENRREMKN
jgi:hypothetical protein